MVNFSLNKGLHIVNRIALYGGSFDPPHTGHLEVIKQALRTLDIQKLFVIPNHLNPFKESVVASGAQRYGWLKKITTDLPGVVVSDFEIKQERSVPSIETVRHFRRKYDKIYFIIGSDNLNSLHRWHNFEELDTLVEWVVATRKGRGSSRYKTLQVDVDISATQLRRNLDERFIPQTIREEIKEIYGKQS